MIVWVERGEELPRVGWDLSINTSFTTSTGANRDAENITATEETHVVTVEVGSGSSDIHGAASTYSSGSSSIVTNSFHENVEDSTHTFHDDQSEGLTWEDGLTASGGTVVSTDGAFTASSAYTYTFSSSFHFSRSFSSYDSFTYHPGGVTSVTSSSSDSSSGTQTSSGSDSTQDSQSSEWSGAAPELGSWLTTAVLTSTREFVSFADTTLAGSEHTVTTITSPEGTRYSLTTRSIEASGRSHISATATDSFTHVQDGEAREIGYADKTFFSAGPCMRLYVSPGIAENGVSALCEVFHSVDGVLQTAASFRSSTTTFDDGAGRSSTLYSYETVTHSGGNRAPTPQVGVVDWRSPSLFPGCRPYSALEVTDAIYSSYSIAVAPTVTATAEHTRRASGRTFVGPPGVTQVVTWNSADTLVMESLITDSTASGGALGGGGFPPAQGNMSATFYPGVFLLTTYADTGGSFTTRLTFTDSTTTSWSRGEEWVVEALPAYKDSGVIVETENFAALIELPCGLTATDV
jgi:hypothetical protein